MTKPIQQQCFEKISARRGPGEMAHVVLREERLEDGELVRVAEVFTSKNHSPNCPVSQKHNVVSASVPLSFGERIDKRGTTVMRDGLVTQEAFERLFALLSAPPVPAKYSAAAAPPVDEASVVEPSVVEPAAAAEVLLEDPAGEDLGAVVEK
ncbi:MAG: hypothetical protein ACYDC2_09930 [Solirubrobacteraceae bacterium]